MRVKTFVCFRHILVCKTIMADSQTYRAINIYNQSLTRRYIDITFTRRLSAFAMDFEDSKYAVLIQNMIIASLLGI